MTIENTSPAAPKWKIIHKTSHTPLNAIGEVEYVEVPDDGKIDLYELMEDKAFIEVPITFGDGGYYSGRLNDLEVVGYAVVTEADVKSFQGKDMTPLARRYIEGTLQGFINRAYYPQ